MTALISTYPLISAATDLSTLNLKLTSLLRDSALTDATSLEETSKRINIGLHGFKEMNGTRVGFVAGIRESDGEEYIERNSRRLSTYTNVLRTEIPIPLFSCMDIYDKSFISTFGAIEDPHRWNTFWHNVLGSDAVSMVFFTPRWERSVGARYEMHLAMDFGKTIAIVDSHPRLIQAMEGII
jgi:hypothetical protein